jgi:hypothetical protein
MAMIDDQLPDLLPAYFAPAPLLLPQLIILAGGYPITIFKLIKAFLLGSASG